MDEGDEQILTYLELHMKSKGEEKSENKNQGFQIKLHRHSDDVFQFNYAEDCGFTQAKPYTDQQSHI